MEQPTWHLPAYISHLLERRDNMSQRELARCTELSLGTIQDLMSGSRCTPKTMVLISAKLAETESERYNLVVAHLHDEALRFSVDPSHLVIRHVEGADLQSLDLTPEENAFIGTVAREMESDKNVSGIMAGIASVLVERAALRADLAAKVTPFPGVPREQAVAEEPGVYSATPTAQLLDAESARRAQSDLARKRASSSSSKNSKA